MKPIWTMTGRAWNAETRDHSKLVSVDFERRCDAYGFANVNEQWIRGLVMDRNEAAIAEDKKNGL